MACSLHPAAPGASHPPPAMTGCECAELSFTAVAREVMVEGRPLDEVVRRTGCGQTCTACLPDLQRFLAAWPHRA